LADLGVFRILTVTPVGESGLSTFDATLKAMIGDTSYDAVLMPNPGSDEDGSLTTAFTKYLTEVLGKAGLSLPIIFDVGELAGRATVYQQAIALLAGSLPGAELLAHSSAGNAEQLPELAGQLAGGVPVNALFDLKEAIPHGSLQETIGFLSALKSVRDIPLVLESAESLPPDKEAASLLQKLYTGALDLVNAAKGLGLSRPFKNLKGSQDIHTGKPVINFAGTSSPLFALTCNGKEVARNESGDFSVDMPLQPGKNVFQFEHQDKKYVVNVYYDVKVLESVSPSGSLETTGGIDMVVGAVARRGSTVKATLGAQSVTLQPGSAGGEDGLNADSESNSVFISYMGAFRLPASGAKKEVLGTLSFTASFQGLAEKESGALVTLLPDPALEPPPPEPTTAAPTTAEPETTTGEEPTTGEGVTGFTTTAAASSEEPPTEAPPTEAPTTESPAATTVKPAAGLLTPYGNNGLGTAQMVEVTSSWANARWSSTTDTKYNPTASPLLAGSFDYVSGKQVIDGTTYYQLGSGKRLKAVDLKVIDKGYKLPSNKLQAASSVTGGALAMRFGIDWRIPFQVDFVGQKYTATEGFNGNVHGVASFNATGLEIVFYHTASYSGAVSVGSFPLVSGAEWSRDAAKNTVTLKLTFRDAGKFYGWQAYYEGGELVIRLRPKPPATLNGAVIWLDAGHGGSDPGAPYVVSHPTLTAEKFVNILIASKLKTKLEANGATVHMTRASDVYVSPAERVRMARQRNPDMFISIHTDSTETASPSGTSAFYYRAFSKPLAKAIHDRIVETYKKNIYIAGNGIDNYTTMASKVDRSTYFYPFEVTRMEECPAILVEYGFGSNPTECKVLQTDKYQDLFAQATMDGIADWLRAQ
ncbi:MAG: N-acetylmuramoyl-L-alanine amidase, partial [Oscillospiraceae bacterium]|nr:N-acetylmuramoyl-L-alanine amidase [Oscillospiraceae bacterium]